MYSYAHAALCLPPADKIFSKIKDYQWNREKGVGRIF